MYIFRQRNQLVRLLVRIMIVIRDWQRWSMIEIVLTRCQWMDLAPSVSDNCMLCCSQSLSLSIFLFCNLYFCISAFCVLLLWFCALKVLKNRTMEPSLISIYFRNAFELLIFSLYRRLCHMNFLRQHLQGHMSDMSIFFIPRREDAKQTPRGSIKIIGTRNELSIFHFTL